MNIRRFSTVTPMMTMIGAFFTALLSLSGCAHQASDKPEAKERWSLVSIEASVAAVDRQKREVTLKDEAGNMVSVTVSERVERFDEIKVGDSVTADYWTFLRADFREPTEDEKANPLVVLSAAGKAPKDVDPAAAVGAIVKAVVTVVAIDREGRQAAIQGPRGKILVVPVMDDAVLRNLKVGEVLIMTYAEAVAVSLNKTR